MGSYLSSPIKDKESENGGIDAEGFVDYGSSSEQGWRISQEDAHLTLPDFDKDAMLFAVFDGHGGAEVAKYAALHLGAHLKSLDKYKEGKYEAALTEGFLSFDALLREPVVMQVLQAMSKKSESENGDGRDIAVDGGSSDDEDDEEDLENLLDEADEPISEIMERISGMDDIKSIAQKRINMGQILRAAVAKLSSENGDDSSDSDVDADSDRESANHSVDDGGEDDTDVPSSSSDKAPLHRIDLGHLIEDATDSDNKESIGTERDIDQNGTPSNEGVPAAVVTTPSSIPKESVIIDDDAASVVMAGPSTSSQPSGSASSSSSSAVEQTNGHGLDIVDDFADTDYQPIDEIDSDDDEDDEDDWEIDEIATARSASIKSRRLMLAPGMFEFGDVGQQSMVSGFDSGATACLAFIKDRLLYVANVGDSRCVVSQHGVAVDMSVDHKPEDPTETARINRAGGKVTSDGRVNNGLNLSRALGDHNYKKNETLDLSEQMISAKPDIKTLKLDSSHEFMVIACDGIWNSMSSQEVVDFIRIRLPKVPTGNLSSICEELFDTVIAPTAGGDGTGMDNMTCIIVRLGGTTCATDPVQEPANAVLFSLSDIAKDDDNSLNLKRLHDDDEAPSVKKVKAIHIEEEHLVTVNGNGGI